MKRLGKKNVLSINYLDGVETSRNKELRVVYQTKDGSFWINWMDGRKQANTDPQEPDGFVVHHYTVTINSVSNKSILSILMGR